MVKRLLAILVVLSMLVFTVPAHAGWDWIDDVLYGGGRTAGEAFTEGYTMFRLLLLASSGYVLYGALLYAVIVYYPDTLQAYDDAQAWCAENPELCQDVMAGDSIY